MTLEQPTFKDACELLASVPTWMVSQLQLFPDSVTDLGGEEYMTTSATLALVSEDGKHRMTVLLGNITDFRLDTPDLTPLSFIEMSLKEITDTGWERRVFCLNGSQDLSLLCTDAEIEWETGEGRTVRLKPEPRR